jgi:hypothetical protein
MATQNTTISQRIPVEKAGELKHKARMADVDLSTYVMTMVDAGESAERRIQEANEAAEQRVQAVIDHCNKHIEAMGAQVEGALHSVDVMKKRRAADIEIFRAIIELQAESNATLQLLAGRVEAIIVSLPQKIRPEGAATSPANIATIAATAANAVLSGALQVEQELDQALNEIATSTEKSQ